MGQVFLACGGGRKWTLKSKTLLLRPPMGSRFRFMPTAPLADVEKVQILEFFNNLNIIINFEN